MGSNRALRSEVGPARAIVGRHGALSGGHSRNATHRRSRPGSAGSTRGLFALRGKKLIVLLSGIVLAIAAIVVFAATAAARRGTSADPVATTTAAGHNSDSLPPGAVAPTIGLRPGATSPSAGGLLSAEQTLPKLTTRQLAGQRVIYSYSGLTPPASLISAIKAGQVAGVIFFTDNVKSQAQITAVARQLQKADA